MEELQIEDKLCKVITSADEITIDTLNKCALILNDNLKTDLDKYVEVIKELSNLSVDEIEDLPIDILRRVILLLQKQDFDLKDLPFKNEIIIDGITFKNKAKDVESIKFTVKEIYVIKDLFKEKGELLSLNDLASVIFRELDSNGNISRDFSKEILSKRSDIFKNMTLDVILPYVQNIESHI